jgi:hypothetical protein
MYVAKENTDFWFSCCFEHRWRQPFPFVPACGAVTANQMVFPFAASQQFVAVMLAALYYEDI